MTLAGIFFDEVALMPESFVEQGIARLSIEGAKFWFNCNPKNPNHWFKLNYINKREEKNILYLHFTMEDNLTLSEKVKERYRRMFVGVFYKRNILRLWVTAEGSIYTIFSDNKERYYTEKPDYDFIQIGIDNVGQKIQSSVGKLGKMAIAVFGIRTAFNAVRQAVNAVSQYNPQIAADLEYMRYCIANLLAPAVQWLISLLYTVLSYVNAIVSAWFGINLFSKSSAKNFQKMQSGASNTAKSAKEIQKSLQGFDEMNILQDNTNDADTGGGSAGGVFAPSVDLSGIQAEVPAWLQWIIDNKDLILSILAGIGGAIMSIKLGLGGIKSLGIGLLIGGIVYTIQSLLEYLDNPSWTNFGKVIQGIGVAIVGLGVLIGNIPLIIAGTIVLIIGTIVKYGEKIQEEHCLEIILEH